MELSIDEFKALQQHTAEAATEQRNLEVALLQAREEAAREHLEMERWQQRALRAEAELQSRVAELAFLRHYIMLSVEKMKAFFKHVQDLTMLSLLHTFIVKTLPDGASQQELEMIGELTTLSDAPPVSTTNHFNGTIINNGTLTGDIHNPTYNVDKATMAALLREAAEHGAGSEPASAPVAPSSSAEDIPLDPCHFIHPAVTDDEERLHLHREIANLVRNSRLADICAHLNRLADAGKILLPLEPAIALAELQRMGMPGEECKGFAYKNFTKYYRK